MRDHVYAKRGIFMYGYLDVPIEYLNHIDERIVRLEVTKLQVSGLARLDPPDCSSIIGRKSERTLIIEPGGPDGSGAFYTWIAVEEVTERLSDEQFDVLGWISRGVNASLPSASCSSNGAFRDRWSLLTQQYREVADPAHLLPISDAMNNATLYGCWQRLGAFGQFVSTASVARDVDELRKALGEEGVSGYFSSYGTGIGLTCQHVPRRKGLALSWTALNMSRTTVCWVVLAGSLLVILWMLGETVFWEIY